MDVLVVVPDPELARVMGEVLHTAGHAVWEAADARGALRLAANRLPEIVILDASLPDQGGLDVLRILRDSPGGGRIVAILLADDPVRVKRDARRLDVLAVSRKPVDILDLSDLIRDVCTVRARRPDALGIDIAPEGETTMSPWGRTPAPAAEPAPPAPHQATPHPPTVQVAAPPRGLAAVATAAAAPRAEPAPRMVPLPPSRSTDAWAVLGIPPQTPPEVVAEVSDRLIAAYTEAAWTERSLQDRARAAAMAARVRAARRELLGGPKAGSTPTSG